MKNVQIPYRLFLELIKYHLGRVPADEKYISEALQDKMDKLAEHEKYSLSLQDKKKD